MTNVTGPWCFRSGQLCEHNGSDAPHVMRDVCSGIGGLCVVGSAWSSGEARASTKHDERLLTFGGAQFDRVWADESTEIDHLLKEKAQEWRTMMLGDFVNVDQPLGTLAIPGALPMTSTSSAKKFEDADSLTLDNIAQKIRELMKTPIVKGVWFIDCPEYVGRIETLMIEAGVHQPRKMGSYTIESMLSAIPLYEWDSKTATDEELRDMLKAGRYFTHSPGVWLEMSDGLHRKVRMA